MTEFVQGPRTKEVDSCKETSKAEKASAYAKRVAAMQHAKIPASSMKTDVARASAMGSQAQRWHESSIATSKNFAFRKGIVLKAFFIRFSNFRYMTSVLRIALLFWQVTE